VARPCLVGSRLKIFLIVFNRANPVITHRSGLFVAFVKVLGRIKKPVKPSGGFSSCFITRDSPSLTPGLALKANSRSY
jgi:hypothetical protein